MSNKDEKYKDDEFEKLEVPNGLRLSELTALAEDVFDHIDTVSFYYTAEGKSL